jgi:osmotically-inducible protein OsmY
VATWLAAPAALAQTPATAPPRSDARPEVVIIGTREADAILAAKVEQALEKDPFLYVRHMSVTAEKGVVRVEGYVEDANDMMQVLRLARRVAGKRRVINEIEVVTGSIDHD